VNKNKCLAVQHIVLLKFKPELTQDEKDELFEKIAALKDIIPGITYYCGGKSISKEKREQGFTYGFLVTFESESARDAYLDHPEHQKVGEEILSYTDDNIIVVDNKA